MHGYTDAVHPGPAPWGGAWASSSCHVLCVIRSTLNCRLMPGVHASGAQGPLQRTNRPDVSALAGLPWRLGDGFVHSVHGCGRGSAPQHAP